MSLMPLLPHLLHVLISWHLFGQTAGEEAQAAISAMQEPEKQAALERLSRARPRSQDDLRALLNLYARGNAAARAGVEASLRLLGPEDRAFGPYFVMLLQDEDGLTRMFGLLGALQTRTEQALPLVRELASRRFKHKELALSLAPAEAAEWQLQFTALQALALWEGPKSQELLEQRSREVPAVAGILAMLFWQDYLPRFVQWSESRRREDQERAAVAWKTAVEADKLRPTAPTLRALALERKKRKQTRHAAAVQLGLVADEAMVGRLLEDHARASDADTRLILATALFASRDPRAVPLLEEFVRKDPDPNSRAGALAQLRLMLPWERYAELLKWVAANDPDVENRQDAAKQLSQPPAPPK